MAVQISRTLHGLAVSTEYKFLPLHLCSLHVTNGNISHCEYNRNEKVTNGFCNLK